jgi:hypothetical protein
MHPEETLKHHGCTTWRQVLHESKQFKIRRDQGSIHRPGRTNFRAVRSSYAPASLADYLAQTLQRFKDCMARTIYDKPTRALLKDMLIDWGLKPGQVFTTSRAIQWFVAKYPKLKPGSIRAHLVQASTNDRSRLHHPSTNETDDLLFKVEGPRADPRDDRRRCRAARGGGCDS